jgi:alcohol dehydrogenase, propanol-preferring
MLAYRLLAPGRAELVDVHAPHPDADEVTLRVLAAGVCRTDLSLVRSGAPTLPVTLGHEIVGEVVELGAAVRSPSIGTVVAVYELIGCGRCARCERGEDNLCREASPEVAGVTRDGGMAERVVVPARNLVELGALDPIEAAPLTDAGMTARHAVGRGRPWLTRGAVAVVIGVGGLGRLAVQLIGAIADADVIAVDVDASRVDFARQLGASDAVQAGEGAAERVLETNAGRPVDVAFDFVGSQESLDLAARVTGRGGAIVVAGGGGGCLCVTAQMGTGRFPEREVTIVHTFGGTRADLADALAHAEAGRIHSRVERFGLNEAGRALAELERGRVLGRAVIVPSSP